MRKLGDATKNQESKLLNISKQIEQTESDEIILSFNNNNTEKS